MTMRIGLCGFDSSHSEDFLRFFNVEDRHPGMRVTALWGGTSARLKELIDLSPQVRPAGSIDELIEEIDAVIVGDRHGDLHLRHALPFLAARRPVFIDKPLACSLADAEVIVTAAERTSTPLLSGSALRWQAEAKAIKAALAGQPAPLELAAYGTWYPESEYGGAIFYAIHTIELVQELIGPDWRDVALTRGKNPTIRYRSGATSVVLEFRPLGPSGSSDFGVSLGAHGLGDAQPIPLGDDYMAPVVAEIAKMLQAGASPMSRDQLLAPIALMAAIDRLFRETE